MYWVYAMVKEMVYTSKAPSPVGPYSQAVKVGCWLFVSGQLPIEPETGQLVDGDIKAQTRRALENIKAILEAAGYSLEDVVKVTVYLVNPEEFQGFNEVYSEYFRDNRPARTTVMVKALPKNARIEIDVIACKER